MHQNVWNELRNAIQHKNKLVFFSIFKPAVPCVQRVFCIFEKWLRVAVAPLKNRGEAVAWACTLEKRIGSDLNCRERSDRDFSEARSA